jgi:hypothetical protein
MTLSELYQWEVEHADHSIVRQYNDGGTENPSTLVRAAEVVRASILSRVPGLPRHDIGLDPAGDQRFVRRFGRGIMKDAGNGFKMAEYIHCIHTTHYRLWVLSSTGQSLVTNPGYELYVRQ